MNEELVVASGLASMLLATLTVPFAARRVAQRKLARQRRLEVVKLRLQGKPVQECEAGMVFTRSVWSYIEGKLFPTKWWPVKEHETRTFLRTQIDVRFTGADRLRLILTGCVRVYVTTYTDVEVNDAESLSNVEVHPFKERHPPVHRSSR